MNKPSVFIGSSKEGLKIAEALFACMSSETNPKLWTHNLFLPGEYPMEVLEKQIRQHSFAILVASPDDQLIKRDVSSPAMRDNLLLEFGLFAGALGRRRAFFMCPTQPKIELPSDLLGITIATYDGNRATASHDEIAAAVQIPCQQIRTVINEQWKTIQKAKQDAASQVRASEKGKAIERLHLIVTQLRDAVMVVQRDAFTAVSDERAFNKVKATAKYKIVEITESFKEDAELVGLYPEISSISRVTLNALEDLPFPKELSPGRQETQRKVIDTGLGAITAFLGGEDPIQHVANETSHEVDRRVSSLQNRYLEWWNNHYPRIEEVTIQLQDKLFQAAMELASNPNIAH